MTDMSHEGQSREVESLLEKLDANVVVLRSCKGWQLPEHGCEFDGLRFPA